MDSKTLTASSLSELMDKLEDATPVDKVVVCQANEPVHENGVWKVTYYLKEKVFK